MLRSLLVFAFLPSFLIAADLPGEVLVLPGAIQTGRDPVATDPVRAAIAAGTWTPPKAGDKVGGPRERTWVAAKLKNGSPDLPGASGAYVYVPVESDREKVEILDAAGHSMVYVNGEPRMGDIYRTGYVRIPVLLKKGTNHFLFAPGRGPVKLALAEPKGKAQVHLGDVTLPDVVVGEPFDTDAAVIVLNTTAAPLSGLTITTPLDTRTEIPTIPPLGVYKAGFRLTGHAPEKTGPFTLAAKLDGGTTGESFTLTLNAVARTANRKRTFRSAIDGSVQYYGHVPAKADPKDAKPGLILSLHGASVEAIGQSACYAPKPGLHVVAPTNRRPYGFDWEDWGRLDAIEVLDRTTKELGTDPARTYLTGHSMGGHGTWHVGVTFPSRFAAIAPSAGWVSMWSYAGMRKDGSAPPERELVQRASGPSDTLALSRNLASTGVYILHGDADDNVPVSQARTMRTTLSEFHPDFAYYERPGAGHWWGNECVDWPPLVEYLASHRLPERKNVRKVDFRTANPGVSAECHWATIEAQQKSLQLSHVSLTHDPAKRGFRGSTSNVARLSLDCSHLAPDKPVMVSLDLQSLEVPWAPRVWFTRTGETWAATPKPDAGLKGPHRAGPFKDAFRNRVVFVYGTQGTPEENAWALAKARFDAEQFWYRGNGAILVLPDTLFLEAKDPDRNIVLYGHADMNAAWAPLLGGSPVKVNRGKLAVDGKEAVGDDLGCLLVYPRPGSERASVAAVAGTGPKGLRLTDRLPYFSSGAAYPDWTLLDPVGVRAAGYFGIDWKATSGESAWRN